MMSNSPNWIAHYRKRIEKNRRLFNKKTERPFISKHAAKKYTIHGDARQFHGWSLVYFLQPQSQLTERISKQKREFYDLLQAAGIASKFAFLPIHTYHVTLVGIATNKSVSMQTKIVSGVAECFELFRKNNIQPPRIHVRGDLSPDGSTIIAPIEPVDKTSLDTIYHIRNQVRRRLHPLGEGIVRNTPHNFHGHITLAYIVRYLTENDYAKLKEILQRFESSGSLGETVVEKVTLHRFETMIDWGRPIATLTLTSE